MTAVRIITVPNGRAVRLASYVGAWRALLDMGEVTRRGRSFIGWSHFGEDGEAILRSMREGLHDRINRHISGYGKGRKWAYEWQSACRRAARDVNTPRLAVHASTIPFHLRARLAHRLTTWED